MPSRASIVRWALVPALVASKEAHAAISSTRGVQHEPPLISDDFVVGCIMIMFLMLFAFGEQHSFTPTTSANRGVTELPLYFARSRPDVYAGKQ
jgi:hypothetical protein